MPEAMLWEKFAAPFGPKDQGPGLAVWELQRVHVGCLLKFAKHLGTICKLFDQALVELQDLGYRGSQIDGITVQVY